MIRQWVKIVLLAMLMLIQIACPKYAMRQNNAVGVHPFDDYGGSKNDSG